MVSQRDQLSLRVLEIREHIKLRGNNPLEAMLNGTHHKACLVPNLVLNDGPQAAADHYRIRLATVHGALAFYYYNEAAIHEAIQEARKWASYWARALRNVPWRRSEHVSTRLHRTSAE